MFFITYEYYRTFYPDLSYSECIWKAESNRTIYIFKLRKIIIGIKINPASPLRTNLGVNISILNILMLLIKQQDKLHK